MRAGALLAPLLLIVAFVPANLSAQCRGFAVASTAETIHPIVECNPFHSEVIGALEWTLEISCINGCGEVWTDLNPRHGSADGACTVVPHHVCDPKWIRYNYANGLYAETSAWNMKVFGGCEEDTPVITSGNCSCAPECADDPGGPVRNPCGGLVEAETAALGLDGVDPAEVGALPSGFFTERREVVDDMEFVMADWAVVRLGAREAGPERRFPVARSSSGKLAARRRAAAVLRPLSAADEPERIALLIESPVHPDNRRRIPPPAVELRPAALPYLGERVTAAVRVDLGEDREIRDAQVLYATGSLPDGIDLAAHLRDNLRLRYASEKQHRVIVYGLVDLEAGAARLRDSLAITPLCCCYPVCV